MIPEHFLREIWKDHASFLVQPLKLADGSDVSVLDCGTENLHRGGPDFLQARIAVDNIAISGDIELHLTPDGWHDHKHDEDARYSNVILHVLLEDGEEKTEALPLPKLILRDNLAFDRRDLWDALFRKLYDRSPELPCFPHNVLVPIKFKHKVLEKFGEARLDELIDRFGIEGQDVISESSILERVYQLTMDALGYSQNRVPFRELSSLLPLERLRFVREEFGDDRIAFEALYFGAAGLLEKPSNDFDRNINEYLIELNARWNAIQVAMPFPEVLAESDWAFFRIRPANSPYRRLALAALLAYRYFSRADFDFRAAFFDKGPIVTTGDSPFWEDYTSFRSKLKAPESLLGDERRSAIWLNVILPGRIAMLRIAGAAKKAEAELREQWGSARTQSSAKYLSVTQQELLEGENVSSVRKEQGALLLQRNFCETVRCSECPIGNRLIAKGWTSPQPSPS